MTHDISPSSTIKVAVCIAPGTEEMEAINTIDILLRAGFDVTIASVASDGALIMEGSRGIKLVADVPLVNVADEPFDCVVLPGGLAGSECFRDSPLLVEFVNQHKYDGKLVAAICAAPAVVLEHHQMYPQAIMTAHPAFHDHIPAERLRTKRVVYDVNGNLLTSQGPGTSQEFALAIIIQLAGKAKAAEVAEPMVVWPNMHSVMKEEQK
ncbi:protein deglycase YajL [Photobacterium aphoticum]|uniref:Oxidative-stress-resistance chaperone n=2 Tax=Photobacterium aphoticum TaxID=754436 RepID=A0A0J1GFT3_9GAMM|nr:protein deglycase YajL [Photobacterium aphoticum]KLU98559.1 oxidative-stress-resistance chaperone [Photobacterium aphoticum]PSU55556.1 protein deglycase YajL [Photobacterium aphoticum]GHA46857.1 oxidative-stress-resistance chaperone [Photobacterium aphoticum]